MTPNTITVALVGNPNAGKSTLFNALSGLRQQVGNYPGVTVEMKKGHFTVGEIRVNLIDLPGTYSLAARSPDELVAVDLLLGRLPDEPAPDVVLSIVDASNLDRHLYLTTQLLELGKPVVVAVNMVDLAATLGIGVDCAALSQEFGIPFLPVQANRGVGLDALQRTLLEAAKSGTAPEPLALPAALEHETTKLVAKLGTAVSPFQARRLILDVNGATEQWFVAKLGDALKESLGEIRARLAAAGCPVPAVEARTRFARIRDAVAKCVTKPTIKPVNRTDRIDRVLTHRLWGSLFFFAVLFLVFVSIFWAAKPLMDLIDEATKWLSSVVEGAMPVGPLRSLITSGIIAGVGGVLKFLPQILILFAFIAVLEDCGYMARAAFLMDRIMSRCGLSGKSFIPLLSSVACAIPGIMATRVIENRRDRLATILVAPLISCSARLPVYGLMISLFLPAEIYSAWTQGLMLFGMYLVGFIAAPIVSLVLRKTLLRGERSLFVMELPAYKRPSPPMILRRVIDAGWSFVRRAGTVILATMILVWAVLYFPHTSPEGFGFDERAEVLSDVAKSTDDDIRDKLGDKPDASDLAKLGLDVTKPPEEIREEAGKRARATKAEHQRQSYLGRTGRALEPVFEPLGWDWRIGVAALASFPAREVIVGTMAILYEVEMDENNDPLVSAIRADWDTSSVRGRHRIPVALSVMVFFALCCQCASTLAVIRRETRSWLWPVFTFVYMTVLAYAGAFIVFQVGRLIWN